jgi:hypothetical protein
MTLLQQYSGRYVDSGRLDSCSTFFNRLYSYSVSQNFRIMLLQDGIGLQNCADLSFLSIHQLLTYGVLVAFLRRS